MPLRVLIGLLICLSLAGVAWLLESQLAPAEQRARGMAGERWYQLSLSDRHLGYLHTTSSRDPRGQWLFTSELRFALSPDEPVAITEQLTFASQPPNALLQAEHRTVRRTRSEAVLLTASAAGYAASVQHVPDVGNGAPVAPRQLEFQFSLADYLGFELWLNEQHPATGSTVAVATLDFDRMAVTNRQFEVAARNRTGYLVRNPNPYDATTIQLDGAFVPVSMTMAGLFDVQRSTRESALEPRSALLAASAHVPTDRRLPNHTQIRRLKLGIESSLPATSLWPQARRVDGKWTLSLDAGALTANAHGKASAAAIDLEETAGFPTTDPAIIALSRRAAGEKLTPAEQVSALTRFVHRYLAYDPLAAPRPVLALLHEPVGDCTEFADLFTTLARSLGLPARTVFGLAYADGTPPAFAFHAWNEVYVNNAWTLVDPTWDQTRVDATHIPLPANDAAALQLITGAGELRFTIRDVEYFAAD